MWVNNLIYSSPFIFWPNHSPLEGAWYKFIPSRWVTLQLYVNMGTRLCDKGGPANMAWYRNYIWPAHFINHYHPSKNSYNGNKDNKWLRTWYLITLNTDSLQILMILDVTWHCLFTNSVHYVGISNKQFSNANIQSNFWNVIGQTTMDEMALFISNIFHRKVRTLWCCCGYAGIKPLNIKWASVWKVLTLVMAKSDVWVLNGKFEPPPPC